MSRYPLPGEGHIGPERARRGGRRPPGHLKPRGPGLLMKALVSPLMTSRIDHTTFDCHDAYALSTFWAQVLGFTDVPGDPNEPGHEECMIIDPSGEQKVLFIEVPEDKRVKNRVHFDLVPTDRTRDEEIERVRALGAVPFDDLRQADGTGWLVLTDPEGNEFCILRSDAERQTSA
jgi:catechol 2,3-dioxygenase-like lactoylglutathione lyase family enzyme